MSNKLSEKFMVFVGKCNGALLNNSDISKFNEEASIIANEIDKFEKQINQLKQQLEEKGNEINIKNNKLCELKKQLKFCQDTLKRKSQSNKDLQYNRHNANTQLAIQELEKVKELLLEESRKYPIVYDITDDLVGGAIDRDKIFDIIDIQIKKLKGEK